MKLYILQAQFEELSPDDQQKYIAWQDKQNDHAFSSRSIRHLIQFISGPFEKPLASDMGREESNPQVGKSFLY